MIRSSRPAPYRSSAHARDWPRPAPVRPASHGDVLCRVVGTLDGLMAILTNTPDALGVGEVDEFEEWRAFDALPSRLRAWLREECPGDYSSPDALDYWQRSQDVDWCIAQIRRDIALGVGIRDFRPIRPRRSKAPRRWR